MKYFYSKKIQPDAYLKGAKKYEPLEVGVYADTFEEAVKEVDRCIKQRLKDMETEIKNVEPFQGDEYSQ